MANAVLPDDIDNTAELGEEAGEPVGAGAADELEALICLALSLCESHTT